MLGKLIKHEFRATGRIMWAVYAAMLLLSVAANFSLRSFDHDVPRWITVIMMVITIAWVLSLVIGFIMTIVLIVKRFHQNLLTDEGYLMFTLPTNVHALVWSKMIVGTVWLIATVLVLLLSGCVAMLNNEFLRDALELIKGLFDHLTAKIALNGTAMIVELLVLAVLGTAGTCLQFYSAMAVGYGYVGHKALWSVVWFFIMGFIMQLLSGFALSLLSELDVSRFMWNLEQSLSGMQIWHLSMLASAVLELVVCAIHYVITTWNLKKRLNLA